IDPARTQDRITTAALAIASVALLLAAWPMVERVPLFAFAMFLGALVARLSIHHFRTRMPPLWSKLLVLGLGIGGVYLATDTLVGVGPGIGILLILVSLKLLELRTERDFQVLALLGWFLGLCRLFFAQNLVSWMGTVAVSLLMVTALIVFHSGEIRLRDAFRSSLLLALQSIPFIALLFVFFPRAYTGVRFSFSRGLFGGTGMADHLEPGSFSAIAQNDSPAFHVIFPDRPPPRPEQRYWRGGVLWHCEGLRWTRGNVSGPRRGSPRSGSGEIYRQIIMLQPHGENWLFALDWPTGDIDFRDEREARFDYGEYFRSTEAIRQPLLYEVTSQASFDPMPLGDHRATALQLPKDVPPRAAALARAWRKKFPNDHDFVENALQFITHEEFGYTLSPGLYRSSEGVDTFLFDRRLGFCEHYAAAFATLMRLGGIPSRLVIGYRGGELNEMSDPPRLIVKQSDAHAWCEVWIEDSGWTRIDPTAAIAPDRIAANLQSLLEMRRNPDDVQLSADSTHLKGWSGAWRRTRMFWDNVNYRWDVDILNYGETEQSNLFATLGFSQLRSMATILIAIIILGNGLGAVAILLRKPWRRSADPVVRAYQHFCRRLAAAGVERAPTEGPLAFGERAAAHFPNEAGAIRAVTDHYIRLRYRPDPPTPRALQQAIRHLPDLKPLKK
ncbi:MAG: DUF3488 and transglutaminase-like domain-containing protein, partial [Chthoniobacteraceae bacterium]